jgi:hypothetical protein
MNWRSRWGVGVLSPSRAEGRCTPIGSASIVPARVPPRVPCGPLTRAGTSKPAGAGNVKASPFRLSRSSTETPTGARSRWLGGWGVRARASNHPVSSQRPAGERTA